MKNENFHRNLNRFLGKASLATYAGGGAETVPERPGFREFEYREGPWHYRDSYTGWFRSWGIELVRYDGNPVWNALYGGGMEIEYQNDLVFARTTFGFLKKALSAGEKKEEFQPRGPHIFHHDDWPDWGYYASWAGDITQFTGNEWIICKLPMHHSHRVVFRHRFMGGPHYRKEVIVDHFARTSPDWIW